MTAIVDLQQGGRGYDFYKNLPAIISSEAIAIAVEREAARSKREGQNTAISFVVGCTDIGGDDWDFDEDHLKRIRDDEEAKKAQEHEDQKRLFDE